MENPFSNLVEIIGFLASSAIAISLTWRGGAKWDPHIPDLPKAPAKVAGLITMVILGFLWFDRGKSLGIASISQFTVLSIYITVIALLVYVFISTVFVYEQEYPVSESETSKQKFVGGFWLTEAARIRKKSGADVQTILGQAANNIDQVWPRPSRALCQMLFILGFLALYCGGTLALSSIGIMLMDGMGA